MKNTLGKVCLMSGLVVFSLSGCYGGGSMIVYQKPPKPRQHYIVYKAPPPPKPHRAPHFLMPKAPKQAFLPPNFRRGGHHR
ncbi:MAG: hypothetical protein II972_02170 [Elusimicrobiaceae bacterium]|nr:hypothetical protein [Elusimicrobiaceae bacterium]